MSQIPPGSPMARQFTRFLIGWAMIEGALLAAIVVAMVLEVITVEQMIPLIIAVALVGGVVITWRVMTLAKQNQRRPGHAVDSPELGGPADSDQSGLGTLGDPDPMAKYRDPNR